MEGIKTSATKEVVREEVTEQAECGLVTWVLHGGARALTELKLVQGRAGAFCDSCFTGELLCGSDRMRSMNLQLTDGAEWLPGGAKIRFGGGTAVVQKVLVCDAQVGAVQARVHLSIVKGALPLLLGEEALKMFKIVLDMGARQVTQNGWVLATWEAKCMPMVDFTLTPERGHTATSGAACWVAASREPKGQTDTTVEQKLDEILTRLKRIEQKDVHKDDESEAFESAQKTRSSPEPVEKDDEGTTTKNQSSSGAFDDDDRLKCGGSVRNCCEHGVKTTTHGAKSKNLQSSSGALMTVSEKKEEAQKLAQDVQQQAKLLEEFEERKERQEKREAQQVEEASWAKATKKTFRSAERKTVRVGSVKTPNKFEALNRGDESDDEDEPQFRRRSLSKKVMLEREFAERRKHDGRYVLVGDDNDDDLEDDGDATTVDEGPEKTAKGPRSKSEQKKVAKALRLTRAQLTRIHKVGHAGVDRLMAFLVRTRGMDRATTSEMAHLRTKVEQVVKACAGCRDQAPRRRRVTRIPRETRWLERGWADFFKLGEDDEGVQLWAMAIIDESTAEIAVSLFECKEDQAGKVAYTNYYLSWASKKGHFEHLVSDVGGEYISSAFLREAEQTGKVHKEVTPADSSESHGRVERVVRTLRWTLDRLKADSRTKKWTKRDWLIALATGENAYRNEVLAGGHSSSVRATGRTSSVTTNLLSDTRASGHAEPTELQEIMDTALEAYRAVVADRRLRQMLVERRAAEQLNDGRAVELGDLVAYHRKARKERTKRWHGPARVVGAYDDSHMTQIDHGGILLRVHRDDVRPWEDAGRQTQDPALEAGREAAAKQDEEDERATKELAGEEATKPEEVAKSEEAAKREEVLEFVPKLEEEAGKREEEAQAEEKCPACRQKRLGKPVKKTHEGCRHEQRGKMGVPGTEHSADEEQMAALFSLFEEDDDVESEFGGSDASTEVGWTTDGRYRHEMCLFANDDDMERLSSLDVYRYGWDDLTPEVQCAAFEKGLLDYDSSGSWLRGSDRSFKELRAAGKTVMSGRWVTKAKVDADGRLIGKARWTPRGYEEIGLEKHETDSPTANRLTHRIGEVYGRARRWPGFKADISAAFFSSDEFEDGEEKWVEVPREDPDHPGGKARVARQLLREVPGTKKAPQRWWLTFKSWALSLGMVQSKVDPCLLWIPAELAGRSDDAEIDGAYAGYLACHVDDFKGRATASVVKWLKEQLHQRFEVSVWLEDPPETDFLGERWTETDDATFIDQDAYLDEKLKEVPMKHGRWKKKAEKATDEELSDFRSSLGGLSWVSTRTAGDIMYETSHAASKVNHLTVADLSRLNKVVRFVRRKEQRYKVRLPVLDSSRFKVVCIVDAGEGEADPEVWTRAQGGYIIGLQDSSLSAGEPGHFSTIAWRSGTLKRVTHSSWDAETIAAVEALDAALMVAMMVEEGLSGVRGSVRDRLESWLEEGQAPARETVKVEMHTDSKSLTTRVESMSMTNLSKRRKADVADLRECVDRGELTLVHIAGKQNPADCLTKHRSRTKFTSQRFVELVKTGWYEPIFT